MTVWKVLLILATGTAAGFLNVVGGGGSLLSLPMLIFLGLPSAVANGTNRIALMIQNIVAVYNFRRKGFFDLNLSLTLGIPALIGSIVGSNIAITLPDDIFNKILAVVMIAVLFFIVKQPHKKYVVEDEQFNPERKVPAMIAFFFVGVYGGFIQAGIGYIIIVALSVITGMSLVKINSLKVFIVGFYMISSLLVFIISGNVNWILGLTLAIGNSLGAWLGSNFAVSKGDKWIRYILIGVVSIMVIKLLFNL